VQLPGAVAPAKLHKLRLRVPFTPTNEDGTPGRRTLVTITVEGEDRDHALEAADQVLDRLIVQPALDQVWDEIDQRIEDAIRSGGLPGLLPPPHLGPGPASRQVEHREDARPTPAPRAASEPVKSPRTRAGVEITLEGLLETLDAAGAVLGIPSLLRGLNLEVEVETQLFQPGDVGWNSWDWPQKFMTNDQPAQPTYERVHGGIGP
jgi:hypothetical protein